MSHVRSNLIAAYKELSYVLETQYLGRFSPEIISKLYNDLISFHRDHEREKIENAIDFRGMSIKDLVSFSQKRKYDDVEEEEEEDESDQKKAFFDKPIIPWERKGKPFIVSILNVTYTSSTNIDFVMEACGKDTENSRMFSRRVYTKFEKISRVDNPVFIDSFSSAYRRYLELSPLTPRNKEIMIAATQKIDWARKLIINGTKATINIDHWAETTKFENE